MATSKKREKGNEKFRFSIGFTHYSAKSRNGTPIMGHKISKINIARKLKEIKKWIKIFIIIFVSKTGGKYLKLN
ncbi:MAG: hypothetical protein ACR5KV_07705 [Wolbachia sp.]